MSTLPKPHQLLKSYVVGCISSEGYEGCEYFTPCETTAEKLRFVDACFMAEYGWAVKRYGSKSRALKEWLADLPTSVNIEFYNHKILALGEQFGLIAQNASEKQKDDFLNSWFKLCANKLDQAINGYHVKGL